MSDSGNTAKSIFFAAIEIPVGDRTAYLDAACGVDAELRERVERLLKSHDAQGTFMEQPAVEVVDHDSDPCDAPGPATTEPLPERPLTEGPGTIIGHYKLLQEIGEGGMGVVYMAEQTEPV